jgi:hypothetical protein
LLLQQIYLLVPEPLLEPVDDPVEPLPMLPVVPPLEPRLPLDPPRLPLELEPTPVLGLVVLPEAPAPAPERLSRRHLSRSAPVRPTHLLGTSVDAPVAALSRPTVPVPALLGLPLAPALMPVLGRSLGPVVLVPPFVLAEPLLLAPAALEPDDPAEPELEPPDDCAKVAVERARSAAAVAAVRVFNIMV